MFGDGDVAHVVQQARESHLLDRRFGQAQLPRRDLCQSARPSASAARCAAITNVERIGERQNGRELLVARAVAAVRRRQHADDLLAVDHGAGRGPAPWPRRARRRRRRAARGAWSPCCGKLATPKLIVSFTASSANSSRDRLPQPLGQHERAVVDGVGHDQRELLAAEPRQGVDAALLPVEGVAGARQRVVTLVVPEPVVDLLEVVEVADHDAQLRSAAPRALELELECLLEPAPVQQPGERVGAGGVGELRPPSGPRGAAARRSARTRRAGRRPSAATPRRMRRTGCGGSAARPRSRPRASTTCASVVRRLRK